MSISKRGFTVIEVIVSLSILCVLSVPLLSFISFSVKSTEQLVLKNILMENARFALEFLTTEINMAEEIDITLISNDNDKLQINSRTVPIEPYDFYKLDTIAFRGVLGEPENNAVMLIYRYNEFYGSSKYNLLEYAGRDKDSQQFTTVELVYFIADIRVAVDFNKDLIYFTVTSDDRVDYSNDNTTLTDPVVLDGSVSIRNKKICKID